MVFNKHKKGFVKTRSEIIAAVDIGSTKVCCLIGRVDSSQKLKIIGHGYFSSKGFRSGSFVDVRALESSISNAVNAAEQMCGQTINDVYVNVSSDNLRNQFLEVELHLNDNMPINVDHLKSLFLQVKNICAQQKYTILHAIPLEYIVDSQTGIQNPQGIYGKVLKAKLHAISIDNVFLRNLVACFERCHLNIAGLVCNGYASGFSCLTEDELDLGAIVIDMGGMSTTISAFKDGSFIYMSTLLIGGNHLTSDIAYGLSTSITQAERLKTLFGSAMLVKVNDKEVVQVPQIGQNGVLELSTMDRNEIIRIIRPRLEELLELIQKKLLSAPLSVRKIQRIILTGGASQLSGIRELTAQYLGKSIRLGTPIHFGNTNDIVSNPSFSVCTGVLMYANGDLEHEMSIHLNQQESLWTRMSSWFKWA